MKKLGYIEGKNIIYDLKETDFDHIVKVYSNDFCSQGNPRNFNYDEVVGVLKGAL